DPHAIHLPEIDLPAIVAPEHVVVAVAVEVAGALNVPIVGNWRVRGSAPAYDLQAIHLPELDLPTVVAPENAALAVAIEVVRHVARARSMSSRRRRGMTAQRCRSRRQCDRR